MKRILRISMFVLAFILTFYIIESIVLSIYIKSVVNSAYSSFGENNPYGTIISDDDYRKLNYRIETSQLDLKNNNIAKENNITSIGTVFHYFLGGKYINYYQYGIYNKESGFCYCSGNGYIIIYFSITLEGLIITTVMPENDNAI